MIITTRETSHGDVTEPAVHPTAQAGKAIGIIIELPEHVIDLNVPEARRLLAALERALKDTPEDPADLLQKLL